jgi:MFS family permease
MTMSATAVTPAGRTGPMTSAQKLVIFASSLGTVFEWYDFYLYATLATAFIGPQFFSNGQLPKSATDLIALLVFAAGFFVRPFGALFFGRIGDLVGRKYTFLITIIIMGASTFLIGLLPSYASIGVTAPIILILGRLLQGLALGGEYGGAATYVAENAPEGRRGFFTSWIQTTATGGLFLSLIVILVTKSVLGDAAFKEWGWRVPFLLSIVLLGISVWIRLKLNESPVFLEMKAEGKGSKAPLTDSFGKWANAKYVLLALFGLTMGQGVVWYAGQFYALFFLNTTLKVDSGTTYLLIAWALLFAVGFFVFFGWLSDKIGRKPIILAGCLTANANPALAKALNTVEVTVIADPADCGTLFNPIGTRVFTSSCDLARDFLAKSSVRYTTTAGPAGEPAKIKVGDTEITAYNATKVDDAKAAAAAFSKTTTGALQAAGYPKSDDPGIVKMANPVDIFRPQVAVVIGLLFILVFYVTMVYGPIAAALVELFPTRIRYTSMSLPYHIGNGWFGGLLPYAAFAMVAQTGDIYFGLWYPIIFALATFVIGLFLIPETKDRNIHVDYER